MNTAILVAALVAGLALLAPGVAAASNAVPHVDAGVRILCPPLPYPLNIPCETVQDICEETRLCE